MGKAIFLLLALALLGGAFAYTLNVTVEDGFGTKLFTTRVEALKGQTAAASATADVHGKAQLVVDAGAYFLRLLRNGYPEHIVLVTINSDTELKTVMNNKRQTALMYGQVKGEGNYDAGSIYLLSDWKIISTAKIQPGGYYIFPYILPGKYSLRLNNGSDIIDPAEKELAPKDALYQDITVQKKEEVKPPVKEKPVLSSQQQATVGDLIVVTLKEGGRPLVGEKISASTPSGTLSLTTDESGQVGVNALEGGKYVFTWNDLQALTDVPIVPPEQEQAAPPQETAPPPVVDEPGAKPPQAGSQDGGFIAAAGVAFVMLIMLAGAALAGLYAYRKMQPPKYTPPEIERKQHPQKKKK